MLHKWNHVLPNLLGLTFFFFFAVHNSLGYWSRLHVSIVCSFLLLRSILWYPSWSNHLPTSWRTSGFFPVWGYYKWSCYEHSWLGLFYFYVACVCTFSHATRVYFWWIQNYKQKNHFVFLKRDLYKLCYGNVWLGYETVINCDGLSHL